VSRAILAVLLLAGVVIGVAVALSDELFGDPPPSVVVGHPPPQLPPPAPAPVVAPVGVDTPPAPPEAMLVALRGRVQVRRGEGAWVDADVNIALAAADSVRAGRNAEAAVRLGNGVEVRLSPRSELRVSEINMAVSKVRLDEGHVVASVGEGGRTLQVQAKGSDAAAESRGGTFGVVTDGRGQLAVAATTGSVKVTAQGAEVEIGAGQGTTVDPGKAPSAATEVPSSLFLKLGALAATQTNQTSTTVQGKTSPGALVRVGDQVATSDARGNFSMRVPLKDGKNELAVEVVDASGRREDQRLPAVIVDREKPKIDAAVQWGRPN